MNPAFLAATQESNDVVKVPQKRLSRAKSSPEKFSSPVRRSNFFQRKTSGGTLEEKFDTLKNLVVGEISNMRQEIESCYNMISAMDDLYQEKFQQLFDLLESRK
jgi:hypothetical protein